MNKNTLMDWLKSDLFKIGLRHALQAAAGALSAHGIITQNQTGQFVEIGISVVLWLVNVWWAKVANDKALNTMPPGVAASPRVAEEKNITTT